LAEKKEEDQDYWFNRSRPMIKPKLTWWEKWLAKGEDGDNGGNNGEEEQETASARGDPNPESGNSNPGSGSPNLSDKEDRLGEEPTWMNVGMIVMVPA
jgi:hypothetical protein